jgi:hypothetical protein
MAGVLSKEARDAVPSHCHALLARPGIEQLLAAVVDDIGDIYEGPDDGWFGWCDERRWLWRKLFAHDFDVSSKVSVNRIAHNERLKFIVMYLGNCGNPIVLARWAKATNMFGNHGNVLDAVNILFTCRRTALDKSVNLYTLCWNNQMQQRLGSGRVLKMPFRTTQEDREVYDEAIDILQSDSASQQAPAVTGTREVKIVPMVAESFAYE